jgi:hypothetical protein
MAISERNTINYCVVVFNDFTNHSIVHQRPTTIGLWNSANYLWNEIVICLVYFTYPFRSNFDNGCRI